MADNLTCLFDGRRFCGPDCMSYRTNPELNKELESAQQHCVIVSSVERTGRSLNIIGGILNEGFKFFKGKSAKEASGIVPTMPNPLGKKP